MKIYLISARYNKRSYDFYDSAVVIARDEEDARTIHPDEEHIWDGVENRWFFLDFNGNKVYDNCCSWPKSIEDITVTYIGEAEPDARQSVVISSYNRA